LAGPYCELGTQVSHRDDFTSLSRDSPMLVIFLKMTSEVKKWWEENSSEFQREVKVPVGITYGPRAPTEERLKLLGDVRGKNVLEIGCGGAQCGIGFAKKGAKVIGMDISEEQLKYARILTGKYGVEVDLIRGDIKSLKPIKSSSQDIVFSTYALFYVDDLRSCFKEVYRVLKKKGIFVFSTHHPLWDLIDKRNMKVKRCYFDTGKYHEKFKKGTFVSYKFTLGDWINALTDAGFVIERVIEPNSGSVDKNTSDEIVYDPHKIKAAKKIPRTIIFKVKKG